MTTDKYSKGAMRAARRIESRVFVDLGIDEPKELPSKTLKRLERDALIIDEETRPEWIKCAERMPTAEDSGATYDVQWGAYQDWGDQGLVWIVRIGNWRSALRDTHWLPLRAGPEEG